jgi:hypothetical protein
VQVRFRFASDQLCSWAEPVLCNDTFDGALIDEVIVGKQG